MGDICLRFYDENGREVRDPSGNRVIGIDLNTFGHVPRAVGIAGGKRKYAAILGALRGKHINILITDQYTAAKLVKTESQRGSAKNVSVKNELESEASLKSHKSIHRG